MIRFATGMMTSAGGRAVNEDRCNFLTAGDAVCWVVADGLGGQGGGEVASQLAADAMLMRFQQEPRVESELLLSSLEGANTAVCEQQGSEQRLFGMRTTAVLLVADAGQATWAHIGDSRLYQFRGGEVVFQTRDHSVPQTLVDSGEILPAEVRHHEDRNRLLRSLGNSGPLRPELAPAPAVLETGDVFLLCSDGFWELVTEREMEAELAKSGDPDDWLERMEARLLSRIDSESDNYTAIGVFVLEPPGDGGLA